MSVALLSRVGKKNYTLIRPGSGSRDEETGDWIPAEDQILTIAGNEQPLPGKEREMLPESLRSKDSRKFFSIDPVYTVDEADSKKADIIVIDGKEFVAVKVAKYQMGVLDHYTSTLVRTVQSAGMNNG